MSEVLTAPPTPIGPAAAVSEPPSVTFPPLEKALTASAELRTTTNCSLSVSANNVERCGVPLRDQRRFVDRIRLLLRAQSIGNQIQGKLKRAGFPTDVPVAINEGALHDPSASRAITTPDPAFPDHTNPALSTVKMANPCADWRTALGIALRADSGCSGFARKEARIPAAFVLFQRSRQRRRSVQQRAAELSDDAHLAFELESAQRGLARRFEVAERARPQAHRVLSRFARHRLQLVEEP